MVNRLVLAGCTPEPLSNYLKALGVLRLVVEQKQDPQAKGYWQNDAFVLVTQLTLEDLEAFFLNHYKPTPLVAPWNGSTGFYPKDVAQKRLLNAIQQATSDRFAIYGATIATAQAQVDALELTVQPKEKLEKRRLLERLRNELPDEAVKWLDTCALVTSEDLKFPPLTGTGGNDGNFEFSRTFMQQLQELIDFGTGQPTANAAPLLKAALFDETLPGLPFSGKIGQFNPIAAGGANAAPGYDADSRVNPWDFVLMLEGIMLFTAGATRRYEQAEQGGFAYPFTVRPSNVGYGSASEGDESRAELWIPLWSAPVGLKELQSLFSEGRAKVGDRTARYGVDFYRAIAKLGKDRGIGEFVRYSFQVRNGLSYFAIPLDRFQPQQHDPVDRLMKIDSWLDRFRQAAQDTKAPASIKRAQRRLDTVMIELSQKKATLLDVLIALGDAEAVLDLSLRNQERKFPWPMELLESGWIQDCRKDLEGFSEDDQRVFRLAEALASQELRQRLVWARGNKPAVWADKDDKITTWQRGRFVTNLIAMLKRQEIEAEQAKKQQEGHEKKTNWTFANIEDVVWWIDNETHDEQIEAVARALSLVHPRATPRPARPDGLIPPAYALLALVHHRNFEKNSFNSGEGAPLQRIPALLARLAAGDCLAATELAARRLRASGFSPHFSALEEPGYRTQRIAAALAFPIAAADSTYLAKQVLRTKE